MANDPTRPPTLHFDLAAFSFLQPLSNRKALGTSLSYNCCIWNLSKFTNMSRRCRKLCLDAKVGGTLLPWGVSRRFSVEMPCWDPGKHFSLPSLPFCFHFHLPDGGCALTFAGKNLLVYLEFPSLICLNEINGHSCGQIYPKLELSLLGIPANRAHPKQDSTNSNN